MIVRKFLPKGLLRTMMPTLGRKVCPSLSGSSTEPSDDDDNENTENNELNKAIIEYKDEDGMMEDRG